MDIKDVRGLNWSPVDWSNIARTDAGTFGNYVSKSDVLNYIEFMTQSLARKIDMPYEELTKLVHSENKGFFNELEYLYKKYTGYSPRDKCLKRVLALFRFPHIPYDIATPINLIKQFKRLSNKEKEIFLSELRSYTEGTDLKEKENDNESDISDTI